MEIKDIIKDAFKTGYYKGQGGHDNLEAAEKSWLYYESTVKMNVKSCLSCEGHGVIRIRIDLAGDYDKEHCPECNGTGKKEYNDDGN